ncbi:MAG: hypothetical protein C0490_26865, partial [Marivirga sp.]|nr:hypothetical protein [Marivirga sp.]
MKKYTLSFVLLWLAAAVNGQTIERITPATGYHSWKNIQFTNILKGFAETESGKTFTTTDGGNSWAENAGNAKSVEKIPPLKKISLDRWMENDFLALSKISDTMYVGRTYTHNPYIILAGGSGKYWKALNGATYNSVSALWADTKAMTLADNYGNVFYSDDNGRSFTKTKAGDYICWPEIKEHNGSLYYI